MVTFGNSEHPKRIEDFGNFNTKQGITLLSISLFLRTLVQHERFSEVTTAFWSGKPISIEGIVGGSCALAAVALFQHGDGTMVLITPTADDAERVVEDMA